MNRKKIDVIWLLVSVFSFLIMSVSILLMPIVSTAHTENNTAMMLIPGIMFWGFLAAGIASQVVLAVRRRKWFAENKRDINTGERIGLISFFVCPLAAIFDIITVIGFLCSVLSFLLSGGYLGLVFTSLFSFSFAMHCILNGKVYYHILTRE